MKRVLLPVMVAAAVSGCGDPTSEVRAWMADVQARTQPEIEPLPVLEPPEAFAYSRQGIPDPFADRLQEETPPQDAVVAGTGGIAPDPNRPREALEAFPLDSLRMVGTLSRERQLWALIRAPDETVNRVAVGNHLGQNHGKVMGIGPDAVQLTEIIPTASGGWMEREAALAIVE